MAVDPEQIVPPPLLPDSRWFFLYNVHHRRAVLLVLRSSLERVALYVVVVLMCSWMGGELRVFLLSHLDPTPAFIVECVFNR